MDYTMYEMQFEHWQQSNIYQLFYAASFEMAPFCAYVNSPVPGVKSTPIAIVAVTAIVKQHFHSLAIPYYFSYHFSTCHVDTPIVLNPLSFDNKAAYNRRNTLVPRSLNKCHRAQQWLAEIVLELWGGQELYNFLFS